MAVSSLLGSWLFLDWMSDIAETRLDNEEDEMEEQESELSSFFALRMSLYLLWSVSEERGPAWPLTTDSVFDESGGSIEEICDSELGLSLAESTRSLLVELRTFLVSLL